MTPEQRTLLQKLAEQLTKNAENAERMCELLQPEFDKLERREGTWNTYVVRDYADHRNAARRQREEAAAILAAIKEPEHEPVEFGEAQQYIDGLLVARIISDAQLTFRKEKNVGHDL